MNPYPQYLKALDMKTDGKGDFQAKNQHPRENDDNFNPCRENVARRATLSFVINPYITSDSILYENLAGEKVFFVVVICYATACP